MFVLLLFCYCCVWIMYVFCVWCVWFLCKIIVLFDSLYVCLFVWHVCLHKLNLRGLWCAASVDNALKLNIICMCCGTWCCDNCFNCFVSFYMYNDVLYYCIVVFVACWELVKRNKKLLYNEMERIFIWLCVAFVQG